MISDDTEHTCMVAQSLIDAGGDARKFSRRFASRLRWWILALPAGVGKATARSGLKLWLGASPEKAGVFSAGNGPAMRAAIFGAALDDLSMMLDFVRASSRLTHTDPKAEHGAIAIALAAKHSRDKEAVDANRWLGEVVDAVGEGGAELIDLLHQAIRSVGVGEPTKVFVGSLGLDRGVTGYTYHTVPAAIHAWLSYPKDFRKAVTSIIECGGDADTTAAIVGGIVLVEASGVMAFLRNGSTESGSGRATSFGCNGLVRPWPNHSPPTHRQKRLLQIPLRCCRAICCSWASFSATASAGYSRRTDRLDSIRKVKPGQRMPASGNPDAGISRNEKCLRPVSRRRE